MYIHLYVTSILVISPISIPLTHSLSPSLPIHVCITIICKHIIHKYVLENI